MVISILQCLAVVVGCWIEFLAVVFVRVETEEDPQFALRVNNQTNVVDSIDRENMTF